MDEVAEKLAYQLISCMNKEKEPEEIEAVVMAVSEQIKQFSVAGKSR